MWVSNGKEPRRHLVNMDTLPKMFATRKDARRFASEQFGYIRERKDLRGAPHFWRMPRPVKVEVAYRVVK
jgi:hypothetical protein